eukprot:TRINITY_DN4852_c0_g2_i1.p1 TRINITY_DN4852_c0_g2~~TRINITY_DN4852_c0_g2_i1.p1  ORF type:complete len:327 (+),score=37.86 TRINITY_DN4852_c0_g2_i1:126-1106(+)
MALWVVGTIMFLVGLLFVLERGWSYAITQSYFQLKKTKEQEYLVGTLKKIFVYPVKGCSPISVSEWRITSSGLVYDRFWCVAIRSRQSREFSCLSPTEYPSVVLIKPSFTGEMLHLDIPGMETLQITRRITTQKYTHSVRVHGNQKTTGIDEGIIAADWLRKALKVPLSDDVRLFRYGPSADKVRETRIHCEGASNVLTFADLYPLTLITFESLRKFQNFRSELNFRPNLVVSGSGCFSSKKKFNASSIYNPEWPLPRPCHELQSSLPYFYLPPKYSIPLPLLGRLPSSSKTGTPGFFFLQVKAFKQNQKNSGILVALGSLPDFFV